MVDRGKRDEDRDTKNWFSWEWKELLRWNKKHFSYFFKEYCFVKKKDTSFKFVKKITMPGFGESLGYIKCYHLSSPRRITSASNPIRYNCNKICSCSRRPKTILEIKIEVTFLKVIMKHIIIYYFSYGHFPNILKYSDHQWNLSTIWNTKFLQTDIE